jgi:hypothetical protein
MPWHYILFLAALVVLGGVAIVYALLNLQGPGLAQMTAHAWVAMALGVVLTFGFSIGLFALSFHSSRSGHDSRVENPPIDPADTPRI